MGMEAWVRTAERDLGVIGRLLDGGATGIIAPRIETVEQARQVVAAARFPPRGMRSQIALLPQLGYRRKPAPQPGATQAYEQTRTGDVQPYPLARLITRAKLHQVERPPTFRKATRLPAREHRAIASRFRSRVRPPQRAHP